MHLIWNYLKNYRALLGGTLVLAAINQIFSLLDPIIFQKLIDNYATKTAELTRPEFIRGVLFLLAGSVGVALVSRIAKNFQDYFTNVITQRLGARMYADSVSHSFSLPYAVFEDQRSGELLGKLQKARSDAQHLVASVISTLFLSLIGIIFVLIYAFHIHALIGIVFFLIIPTLGSVTFFLSRKIKSAQQKIVTQTTELAGATTETIRNIELVKSLGLEDQEIGRLNTVNDQILSLELSKIRYVRTLEFVQGTIINALRVSLLFVMLWLIYTGAITVGSFFSLLFYSFFIFTPLASLGALATQYQEAMASSATLQEVLSLPPSVKPENPASLERIHDVVFSEVSFSYATREMPAVRDVSFSAAQGETIAFAGLSGSGKSTLIKLLAGLYSPTSGTIRFNSTDSSTIDFDALRRKIGLVAQETQLFAGTIRDNLLFVNPEATEKACVDALKAAQAYGLIERGDKGLDTKIGEGGIKLSGGERQRLAIARALLRQPEILIFDEATSSLDSLTEREITSTMKEIGKGHPLIKILVAHRLSTIAHADRIYVLQAGAIVESGRHEELLTTGGLYGALWREQIAQAENTLGK